MGSAASISILGPIESQSLWLNELARRLFQFAKVSEKPVNIVDIIEGVDRAAIKRNIRIASTGRAGEYSMAFEPSQGLLDLMAALRAFQGVS